MEDLGSFITSGCEVGVRRERGLHSSMYTLMIADLPCCISVLLLLYCEYSNKWGGYEQGYSGTKYPNQLGVWERWPSNITLHNSDKIM